MPVFEIREDAVKIALRSAAPTAAVAPLPALSDAARRAVDQGEQGKRLGSELAVRRINTDRLATRDLRDWFIHAEVSLQASPDPGDRGLAAICRETANALIVAFATGRDFPARR